MNKLFTDMMKASQQSENVTAPAEENVAPATANATPVSDGKNVGGRPRLQGNAALRTSWVRARVSDEELAEIKTFCFANKMSVDELIRTSVLEIVRK